MQIFLNDGECLVQRNSQPQSGADELVALADSRQPRGKVRPSLASLWQSNSISVTFSSSGKRLPGALGTTKRRLSSARTMAALFRNCSAEASELPPNLTTFFIDSFITTINPYDNVI